MRSRSRSTTAGPQLCLNVRTRVTSTLSGRHPGGATGHTHPPPRCARAQWLSSRNSTFRTRTSRTCARRPGSERLAMRRLPSRAVRSHNPRWTTRRRPRDDAEWSLHTRRTRCSSKSFKAKPPIRTDYVDAWTSGPNNCNREPSATSEQPADSAMTEHSSRWHDSNPKRRHDATVRAPSKAPGGPRPKNASTDLSHSWTAPR